MNPLIPILEKYGVDAILEILTAWKMAGEPGEREIRAIDVIWKPENYFIDRIEEE